MSDVPTNPYSTQLSKLPELRSGSRAALDAIYKAMRTNLGQFGKRLDTLNRQTGKTVGTYGKELDTRLANILDAARGAALDTAAYGGGLGEPNGVDAAEQSLLASLATDDVREFQGFATTLGKGESTYQSKLRGIDKQFAKDLLASAVREKQARGAELEQNLLDFGAGLRSNEAMFGAQQDLLGFQQSQLGGGGFGPQAAKGSYTVGAFRGLSAAEAFIIQRESGGNPRARNPSSGAFGGWQGNPSSGTLQAYARKVGVDPYTTDVNAQLAMFRLYVKERYGTAENAAAFWKKNGWY